MHLLLRLTLTVAVSTCCAWADVKLPSIISDHMVLEKSAKVPIWGRAGAGEEVTVTMNGISAKAVADAGGKWMTTLNLQNCAPGPFEMTVEGNNQLTLVDVVVGEVWLASGQSNMAFVMSGEVDSATEVPSSANTLLREFKVQRNPHAEPQDVVQGKWVAASPETTGNFSAVGYFFGKKLQRDLNVPIGIVNASVGGTPSEAWTSAESLLTVPALKDACEPIWAAAKDYPGKKKAFVDGLRTWIKSNGCEDKPSADVGAYVGENISSDGWVPVRLPGDVIAPGLPKSGVVWLRKEVTCSGATTLILPIDGFDRVYWNGKILQETSWLDFPGTGFVRRYNVPPAEVKQGKNVLAIRLYEPVGPAKVTAEPKAGTASLAGEWLAKAEREFPLVDKATVALPSPPANPPDLGSVAAFLYNGMINPIIPYAIRGAIWYQGEANVHRAVQYKTSFPLLITDWRKQWDQGDFPFYFCQLTSYAAKSPVPRDSLWAEVREAQSSALSVPKTGQAVIIDLGEASDIHPRNKRDVGERLALLALAKDYGKAIPFSGPAYDSMKVENGKAILQFQQTDGGLVAKALPSTHVLKSAANETAPLVRNRPSSELEGFAICGEDKKWVWADARIDGNAVVVWSDEVPVPIAVRYAWSDNPTCNLFNGAGLPASPFRTDNFPLVTANGKY